MRESVLAESVKAALNGKKVVAALFLTYNFDAAFFENYVLPLCMDSDLKFGSSAAQNAMLWIRHGSKLPLVAVLCDYYGKNDSEPPRLNYDVVCMALKGNCFHPKNVFLLCEDGELLLFTGSANISYSGWCHNIESMSMIRFIGGVEQDAMGAKMREYLEKMARLTADHTGTAKRPAALDKILRYFVNARMLDVGDAECDFYHSASGSFSDFLVGLRNAHNDGRPFDAAEIVSPYFSPESSAPQYDLVPAMCTAGVDLALPWSKPGQAGITGALYEDLPKKGYRWLVPVYGGDGDQFRFTHGKIYRFKGAEKMISIVGSVNFTQKGFAQFAGKNPGSGNVECALAIVEPVERWKSLFNDQSPCPEYFVVEDESSMEMERRVEIPPLFFVLDWAERKLIYSYQCREEWKNACSVVIQNRRKKLEYPRGNIDLSPDDLEHFSDSCVITVRESKANTLHHYFPKHEHFQAKPVPPKLRLSIPEIFNLWANLGDDADGGGIAGVIDRACRGRVDENGEITEEDTSGFSSLNLMAQHLSGIDHLHRYIFSKDGTVAQSCPQLERARLLFSDGLDTLPHYCRQLARLAHGEQGRERLSLGFYWLVLSIVKKKFYIESHSRLKSDMANAPEFPAWLDGEIKAARKTLERKRGVDYRLLAWAEREI